MHDFGRQPGQARFQHGPLARLLNARVHFRLRLFDDLFDAARMDAPVHDQVGQGDAGHFAPHRIEAGQHDRFRRIVNDQVHAGHGLEGADIAAFAPDDAAFHLVVGQRHDGNGGFRGLIHANSAESHP